MRAYKQLSIPESVWKKPSHFIAFGFGIGAVPFAPGTFGTLLAIPFYLAFRILTPSQYLLLLTVFTLASIWLCDKVAKEIKVHDHPGMCLDEFIGFWVTMFAAPHGSIWILIGFILFRLFDIWKPWPIRLMDEKMQGGLGIIADDIAAGIYSCIILHILYWVF